MSGVRVFLGEDEMRSTSHGHVAIRGEQGWSLSWLPGRVLTRHQAVTGMMLAELFDAEQALVAGGRQGFAGWAADNPRFAPHIENWAGELGISADDAFGWISAPAGDGPAVGVAPDLEAEAELVREQERAVERAVQLAADDEVTYGPTGDVVLRRDPYDILAEGDHGQAVRDGGAVVDSYVSTAGAGAGERIEGWDGGWGS